MLPNSSFIPLHGNIQQNSNINQMTRILPVKIKPPFDSVPTFFINTSTIAPNMIMGTPIIQANFSNFLTTTSQIPVNFEEYPMPLKVLNEFQKEIVKVLNKPKEMLAPVANIIDIPQHIDVKVKFVTEAEMHQIEMERRREVVETKKVLKVYTNNNRKTKAELEDYVNSTLRIPSCHKSIQCSLLKDEDKSEKVKKANDEEKQPKSLKIDKCISTADYDLDFENDFVYVTSLLPSKERMYKYLNNGHCECLKCGKVCRSSGHMKRHVEQHREKSLLCCKCGKMFKTTICCTHHEMFCGVRGLQRTPHPDRTCKYCGRLSKSMIEHLDHVNSHTGEKPHKCSCGAQFGHVYNLRNHHRRFGCKISFRDTAYGIKLKPRSERYNGKHQVDSENSSDRTSKSRSRRKDPDRYVCKVCSLRCRDYTHFRAHRLKHITERKFVCKTCNNCYKDMHGLKSHIKTKHLCRVECSVCGKTTTMAALTGHMRTHTGEKPFVCDVCQDKFSSKQNLNRHKFEKHKIGNLKFWEKPVYKCYLCNEKFCAIRSFHNHLNKEKHCQKEKYWQEKFSISAFGCTYCTKQDLVQFADYAAHAGKNHNMHIYGRMELIFQGLEKLKNSDLAKDVKIESNDIEDIKTESNEIEDIKTEWSEVEGIKIEYNSSNEDKTKTAKKGEISEDMKENAAKMVENIKKELILEEFMDKFTSNTTEENTDIKFEEMDTLDEFLNSLPKNVENPTFFK